MSARAPRGAAAWLAVCTSVACTDARPPQPNVLLVVVDTLRADRLGTYGYARDTSPRIDAFAERAVVFEQALTSAPWTTPAVGAILTGLPPTELGVRHKAIVLDEHFTTLAEELGARGYVTAGVVSHLFVGSKLGFDQGFDTWDEHHARGHDHVSSAGVTDLCIEFLEGRGQAREPFFLFAHYFDPHYDYVEQRYPELVRPYEGKLTSERDNIAQLRRKAAAGRYGPEDVQHLNDLYDSEIRFTDEHIGRLFDALARLGLEQETLVILTADHGEALMDRPDRWIGHTRTLFEEQVRVPLIVKPPGPPASRRVATPVTTLDVFPTVLDALGLAPPPALAGRSLLGEPTERTVFAATYRDVELQMVRRGRFKLVHDRVAGHSVLFDLAADPHELENVAHAHPDVLAELEREREAWHERRLAALAGREVEEPALTSEELERLDALGY